MTPRQKSLLAVVAIAALGASGRRYVQAEYRWDVVLERWRELIRAAAGGRI